MPEECGQCGAKTPTDQVRNYAVRVDGRWVARFTYCVGNTQTDKEWDASEGIRLASHCKGVLGVVPYIWTYEDSAHYTAVGLGGEHVWLCDNCLPKDPSKPVARRASKRSKERHPTMEDDD